MKRKILIFLSVLFFMLAGATSSAFAGSLFLGGVDPTDNTSYTDSDKTASSGYCWAHAASNVLEWGGWDDYGNFGTEDDIMVDFDFYWTNAGSWARFGWEWWFTGSVTADAAWSYGQSDTPPWSNFTGGGSFYSPPEYNDNIRKWEHAAGDYSTLGTADYEIMDFIGQDYGTVIGLGMGYVGTDTEWGHALTLWGYETNATGDLIGVYVTDSDDYNPTNLISYYAVGGSWVGPNYLWYLDGYGATGTYNWIDGLGGLHPYEGNGVPEPATLLLLGSGLLGLFIIGRKKFKRS